KIGSSGTLSRVPEDPIFRLTFPQKEMLSQDDFENIVWLLETNASKKHKCSVVRSIQSRLNPHPDGQLEHNIPTLDGSPVSGIQHKYQQTVLIFPSFGQTCHAYCTFCFRWPQFVGVKDWQFATSESGRFQDYLRTHKEVTDVLITGGDPMIMSAKQLSLYIEPLLGNGFEHIRNIRIGTKSLAYWPYRFVSDSDADDILKLFEQVHQSGKKLFLMTHFVHAEELSTNIVERAIKRILSTGTQVRTQAPIMRGINDSSEAWTQLWQKQMNLGCIPYYMFVARDTGARQYFEVSLFKAWKIYQQAIQTISGLGRVVRGPIMSALPGKILVHGVSDTPLEKVFTLSFIQGRDSNWCNRPFFARFDSKANWLDDLTPAFGDKRFFYEEDLERILTTGSLKEQ
ncbi:MAG: lysine 2,3-aminomutase, partial [Cyanobacteria bacterium J06600_6]